MRPATPCSQVDCAVFEPDRMVERRLSGTGFVETYCESHDPIRDPVVGDMWVRTG